MRLLHDHPRAIMGTVRVNDSQNASWNEKALRAGCVMYLISRLLTSWFCSMYLSVLYAWAAWGLPHFLLQGSKTWGYGEPSLQWEVNWRHLSCPGAKVPLFSHFYLIEFSHHLAGLPDWQELIPHLPNSLHLGEDCWSEGRKRIWGARSSLGLHFLSWGGAGGWFRWTGLWITYDLVPFLQKQPPYHYQKGREDVAEMREEGTSVEVNRESVG